jgi:hypothetical protein
MGMHRLAAARSRVPEGIRGAHFTKRSRLQIIE